jgi:type I restriction enzyme S subunit
MKQTSVPNTDNNSKSQLSKKSDGSNSSKWQVKKLGEVCEIEWKRGSGLRKSDLDEHGENKCILYGELYTKHKNVLIENNNISRTNKIGKVFSKKGDILVPGTSTAAKQDMLLAREIDEDGVFLGGDINIIRPKQGIFAQKYLPYFFETETAFDQLDRYITGATGIIHISNTGLKQLNIPLPPLAEQKAIVAVLDQAFGEIEKVKANTEKNLNNAKELFQSYLQGVFENKGDDWEEKKLGELCEVIAGGDVPKGNFSKIITKNHIVPIYANGEKKDGLYGYTNIARINEPSITVSARGTIGYSVKRTDPFFPVVRLIVLTPKDNTILDLDFLLLSIKKIDFTHSGTSIPQLTVPMVKDYNIHLPPLAEQKAIVQRLDSLRADTQRLESIYRDKLLNLEELRKSILQKAFSGELVK